MLGDAAATDLTCSDGVMRRVPALAPLQVVAEAEVDQLVRSARAGIAMLSLRLRTVLDEVVVTERASPEVDLVHARELAISSLEKHLWLRRRELAEELEQARADVAFTVTAARSEAAELVAAASEETRQILLAGLSPVPAGPPSLRVVSEGAADAVAPHADSSLDVPTAPVHESPTASIAAPTAPNDVAAPATATVHIELDASRSRSDAPAEPVAGEATGVNTTAEGSARRGPSRYLYADVVLPMIAVLVVVVVLLAWVG